MPAVRADAREGGDELRSWGKWCYIRRIIQHGVGVDVCCGLQYELANEKWGAGRREEACVGGAVRIPIALGCG